MLSPRSRFAAVTAAVLAASFGFALLGSVAFHTDDGCAVELHCFACHWSLASTGVAVQAIALSMRAERLGDVASPGSLIPPEARAAVHTSRGPPSA